MGHPDELPHPYTQGPLQVLPQQLPASISRLVAGAPVATLPSLHRALLAYSPKQKHKRQRGRLHNGARREVANFDKHDSNGGPLNCARLVRSALHVLASYPPTVHVRTEEWRSGCPLVADLHRVLLRMHSAILLERALRDVVASRARHRGVAEQSDGGFGVPCKKACFGYDEQCLSNRPACTVAGNRICSRQPLKLHQDLGLGAVRE